MGSKEFKFQRYTIKRCIEHPDQEAFIPRISSTISHIRHTNLGRRSIEHDPICRPDVLIKLFEFL
ncbi:hypothetical protein F511_04660 [Dorcoceras hygrometricum]|uniref:Uncharacterized protein n=1 Tax=Dorcoceras hygrometricum TaxID=472368 RepID=A0A2Z7B6K4_9LAMI|nr:hypothetical protein F511_04660 [Dorcoceras hygrometricum]